MSAKARLKHTREAPYFPFYAQQWLTDPALVGQPPVVKGALIELRARAWVDDPPCTLPSDDASLAAYSGLGRLWPRYRDVLRRFFTPDGDRLRDPLLTTLFEHMESQFQRRSEAGKKAARVRWPEELDEADEQANEYECIPIACHTEEELEKDRKKDREQD